MMNPTRELDPSLRIVTREQRSPAYATAALPCGAVDPVHLARHDF
jgi:hypothetical protein